MITAMQALESPLQRLLRASPLTLAVVLFPLAGLALDVKDVPNPRQLDGTWVTDMAGMLSDRTEAQLNQTIAELERKNGTEIAVVTVPETAPATSPKQFTTKLFHYWGVGKKGRDNGVLFLISKSDRRVEIETGYGIEAILPDAKVGTIISSQITPQFKQGNFDGGTLAGTKALVAALEAPEPSAVSEKSTPIAKPTDTQQTTLAASPFALVQEPEPTQDANVPWGLLVGGGLVLAIGTVAYAKSRRVFLEPEGRSRFSGSNRVCLCANCKQRMEKVDTSRIEPYLSQPEKVAQQLGSVKFEGWKCPNCIQQLTGLGFHIIAWESHSNRFRECPTCKELTATRTNQVLKHPTEYRTGKRLIIEECHCCSYRKEREETIPRLPPPPPPPPPSTHSGGGSSGSGFSGGGYSGGDCSGGGFGGGSSGGGGAGGSW
jgi:uncharacterized protein